MVTRARSSKYHAQPEQIDGIRFASKAEGRRYRELKLLEKAGEIIDLQLQPEFAVFVADVLVCRYLADFRYTDLARGAEIVVEDVKGFKTPVYRLKKKLVEARYGIRIVEV